MRHLGNRSIHCSKQLDLSDSPAHFCQHYCRCLANSAPRLKCCFTLRAVGCLHSSGPIWRNSFVSAPRNLNTAFERCLDYRTTIATAMGGGFSLYSAETVERAIRDRRLLSSWLATLIHTVASLHAERVDVSKSLMDMDACLAIAVLDA